MEKKRLKDYLKMSDITRFTFFVADSVVLALDAAGIEVDISGRDLNHYFYQRNYLKILAPLIQEELGDETGALAASTLHSLTSSLCHPFYDKWVRLYKLLVQSEYDPIANVDANETFTTTTAHGHTISNTGTSALQHGEQISRTGTEQLAHGEQISRTGTEQLAHGEQISRTGTEKNDNGVFGFNSATAVNSDSATRTDNLNEGHSGSDTRTDNLNEGHSGSDTRTDNLNEGHSGSDTRTDNLSETHSGVDLVTETRTRKGNIGVTMTQQMMNAEIEVRKKNFWDLAFEDIEKVLFINIY